LFRYRQQLCGSPQAKPTFSAVTVAPELGAVSQAAAIEVEFATGARMRITGPVDASTVRAMIAALAKAKRQWR